MHIAHVSQVLFAMRLPDPVAFRLGGFSVYWTGIFLAAGILAALLIVSIEAKRKTLPPDTAVDLCLVLIPCGVVGARLIYVLTNLSAFRGDWTGVFRVWDGGLSQWGALLFCALGLFVYASSQKLPFPRLLDLLAPGLALGQAIIVWGDFFNQQNFGRTVTAPALKWFPLAVRIECTGSVHYATFFYTFLLCAAVFLLIWFVLRRRARHDGEVFLWYVLLLCAGLSLIGCWGDIEGSVFGALTVYQLIGILLALLAAALLLVLSKRPVADAANAETQDAPDELDDADPTGLAEAPCIACECRLAIESNDGEAEPAADDAACGEVEKDTDACESATADSVDDGAEKEA